MGFLRFFNGSVTRSCIINCFDVTISVWGNPTEVCVSGNAGV